jgi:hypothetical protein
MYRLLLQAAGLAHCDSRLPRLSPVGASFCLYCSSFLGYRASCVRGTRSDSVLLFPSAVSVVVHTYCFLTFPFPSFCLLDTLCWSHESRFSRLQPALISCWSLVSILVLLLVSRYCPTHTIKCFNLKFFPVSVCVIDFRCNKRDTLLRNVCNHLQGHASSQPIRTTSTSSPPRDPKILFSEFWCCLYK